MNIALVLLRLFLKAKLGIDSRLIFAAFKLVPGEEWLREQGRSHSGVGSRGLKGSISQPESFIRCDFVLWKGSIFCVMFVVYAPFQNKHGVSKLYKHICSFQKESAFLRVNFNLYCMLNLRGFVCLFCSS